MAWKSKATPAANNESPTKTYFWCAQDWGNGIRRYMYVTADALATVDGSGYITEQAVIDILNVGDQIQVYVADAIDDSQTITADLEGGLADVGLLIVMENTGTVVDLSATDVYDASGLTYGD